MSGAGRADVDHAAVVERLLEVRRRIADAAVRSGRDPATVKLIAVTKTVAVDAIRAARAAGQCDFGENYLQEAAPKISALAADAAASGQVRWHMIGRIQSNKAAKLARLFSLLHGLDSLVAAEAISRAMSAQATRARVLLQVRLGGGAPRAGIEPRDASDFLRRLALLPGLTVCGVMGVAPPGEPARPHFARLRGVLETLRSQGLVEPPPSEISAGMSTDYADAIAEGATLVRIGSAIFGERPPATRGKARV